MNGIEKKEIEETLLNSFNKDELELSFNGEVVNDYKMLKVLDDITRQALIPYFSEALYNAGYGKVEELEKEIERLQKVEAELQELNIKYYNEAKDSRREIVKPKEDIAKCISVLEDKYTFKTTLNRLCDVFKIIRKQAIKEFAEKLKDKFNGYEATSYNGYEEGWHDLQEEINELLKEYEVKE